MKFKVADVPVNVLEGIEKNPAASMFVVGIVVGILICVLLTGDKSLFIDAACTVVAGLVAAYFAGKPK